MRTAATPLLPFTFAAAAAAVSHFRLVYYRFVLKATTTIELPPYKGSAFHGGFGHALKRTVCVMPKQGCTSCLCPAQCLYPYIFETKLEAHDAAYVGEETIPRPFVLVPPLEDYQLYQPGDLLTCDLVLIGDAIAYVLPFIDAMIELGRVGIGRDRGHYTVTQVQSLRPHAPAFEVYFGEEGAWRKPRPPITGAELVASWHGQTPTQITMAFLTPTRLKYQSHLLKRGPEFHVILRRLLDRLTALSLYYHETSLALDVRAWKHLAEQIRLVASRVTPYDWERYSNRQQTHMKLGGLLGTVTYAGELAPFLPLLALGEWLHVGKGATFGLGKYRIVESM
jgi:hypothetical protein